MNEAEFNDIITVDELCEILMIGKNMAYRLLNDGEIRCFKMVNCKLNLNNHNQETHSLA